MKGIYSYTDKTNGEIVYIGKDSDISNTSRHYQHLAPSRYWDQPFNRIIQNNTDRYSYDILCKGNCDDKFLSDLEKGYIRLYSPKFNYTLGGEGATGYKHSEESRKKMSLAKMGNKCHLGKKHSEKTKQLLREINTGKTLSEEIKNKIRIANTKNYSRIVKDGFCNNKQMYVIKMRDKRLKSSNNLDKLVSWFNEHYPDEELEIFGVME